MLKLGTFVVLAGLLLGGIASAQMVSKPNDCCRARAKFTLRASDGLQLPIDEVTGRPYTELKIKEGDVIGSASTGAVCDKGGIAIKSKDWGMICALGTIYFITNWIFIILMALVGIMIVYGGFLYVTAAGDPEKAGKGRNVIMYSLIGLAIALLSKVLPSLVRFVIGV